MILINCQKCWIGDCLFASSLAKKLKVKYPGCVVIYQIPLPQPKLLLEQNPHIDKVVLQTDAVAWPKIDMLIDIPEVDQSYPATTYMQAMAGIEDQSTEFDVWTVPEYDVEAWDHLSTSYDPTISYVAYQTDWDWRAYRCTPETLRNGTGAPHRDTGKIIHELEPYYNMIPVGFDRHTPSSHPNAQNPESFARTASIIKQCDWFIGAEGGLQNLACSIGTKTIITSDFIAQNYSEMGRVKKIKNPQMGSHVYYPIGGHSLLDPCLSDGQLISTIQTIIQTGMTTIYDWETKTNHICTYTK